MVKTPKKLGKTAKILIGNIHALMDKAGWSQAEFARKLKVAPTNISNYLSGKNLPTVESLEEIANVFGVSVAELFQSHEKPEPRVYKTELPDAVRAEITAGNAKLKDEINGMLLPFLAKLKVELGVEEVLVQPIPKEKISGFLNSFLREVGLSADFYRLLDKNADAETLRVEFLREIAQALLSSDGSIATKAKKVIMELSGNGLKEKKK